MIFVHRDVKFSVGFCVPAYDHQLAQSGVTEARLAPTPRKILTKSHTRRKEGVGAEAKHMTSFQAAYVSRYLVAYEGARQNPRHPCIPKVGGLPNPSLIVGDHIGTKGASAQ